MEGKPICYLIVLVDQKLPALPPTAEQVIQTEFSKDSVPTDEYIHEL